MNSPDGNEGILPDGSPLAESVRAKTQAIAAVCSQKKVIV
jgi:hypothetical protein